MLQFTCLPFHQLSLEQLYTLLARRQEVFSVEQTCYYLDADGKDQAALHLMGYDASGNLVAYARLLPKGVAYPDYPSIGRVLTSPSIRRTGAGKELIREALQAMETHFGHSSIKIAAQSYLVPFYEEFGFEVAGENFLEDGIPHTPMIRPSAPGHTA